MIYNECIYALIDWTSSQYIFQFSSGGFYSRYFSISSLFNWNDLVSAGDFLYLFGYKSTPPSTYDYWILGRVNYNLGDHQDFNKINTLMRLMTSTE